MSGVGEPYYADILADFGWAEADDRVAAKELKDFLPARDGFRHVGTELKHRPVASIVGCGPSLDQLTPDDLDGIVIAADGAAGRLRELGVVPRIVVTDLDGPMDALQWAADSGASMVVHAHGNNGHLLQAVEGFPLAAGTYQSTPDEGLAPLRNLGGFTDGDRALMLCRHYGAHQARLLAFDLDQPPSAWSGSFDPATKSRKLVWADRIIRRVADEGRTQVIHVDALAHRA